MSTDIVLFGASNLGKAAYTLLKNNYNIVCFCDNDSEKWGKSVEGIEVIPPSRLRGMDNVDIVIASTYYEEISKQLNSIGINNFKVFKFLLQDCLIKGPKAKIKELREYNIRFLDLGAFLSSIHTDIKIEDMTFLAGGSGLLDYIFLKAVMIKLGLKTYLEIGTWMGESIAAVSEVADKCYSISMPDDDKEIADYFKDILNKSNFSRYFSRGRENIVHFCGDSKAFDFSSIKDKVDLVFIDGDHSYEGVRKDTENIFNFIDKESSIVVWHDFKDIRNKYIEPTVRAIFDVLPESLHKDIFAVDANYCGVYIPERYKAFFKSADNPDILYSYEVAAKVKLNELSTKERMDK